MSIGLGKVEKLILKALKRYGETTIDDLTVLKVHGLDLYDRLENDETGDAPISWTVHLWNTPAWLLSFVRYCFTCGKRDYASG